MTASFSPPPTEWMVAPAPEASHAEALAQTLSIPTPLAALLIQRGHDTPESARLFLRPSLDQLSDPMALSGMTEAVDIIAETITQERAILVHGDYDVDGQCAAALLTRTLRAAGARVIPFVPHRMRDGYDFGPAGVAAAKDAGAGLIITCDCGLRPSEPNRGVGGDPAITGNDEPRTRVLRRGDAGRAEIVAVTHA
ncbi:MAG: hypothetical protein HKM89_11835, partial [Gemmatimonadales bacterium]|nr:hypothetical protein [Gemmatimonadales bacterium]